MFPELPQQPIASYGWFRGAALATPPAGLKTPNLRHVVEMVKICLLYSAPDFLGTVLTCLRDEFLGGV